VGTLTEIGFRIKRSIMIHRHRVKIKSYEPREAGLLDGTEGSRGVKRIG